jgi:hypothetical protein
MPANSWLAEKLSDSQEELGSTKFVWGRLQEQNHLQLIQPYRSPHNDWSENYKDVDVESIKQHLSYNSWDNRQSYKLAS